MAYFHSSWKANNPWYMYKCSSCGTPGTVDSLILEFSYEESRIQGILSILLNKQGIFSFKVLPVFCFLLGQSCPICLSFTEFSPAFLSIFLPAYLSYTTFYVHILSSTTSNSYFSWQTLYDNMMFNIDPLKEEENTCIVMIVISKY